MKQEKHERKNFRIIAMYSVLMYSVLMFIATLFMCIGYATISGKLNIEGEVYATVQEGIFITDVSYFSNNEADMVNSKIN